MQIITTVGYSNENTALGTVQNITLKKFCFAWVDTCRYCKQKLRSYATKLSLCFCTNRVMILLQHNTFFERMNSTIIYRKASCKEAVGVVGGSSLTPESRVRLGLGNQSTLVMGRERLWFSSLKTLCVK